jgi:hypothetical protein
VSFRKIFFLLSILLISITATSSLYAIENGPVGPLTGTNFDYEASFVNRLSDRRIIQDANGDLHAVYFRSNAGNSEVVYARSSDNGVTWTNAVLATGAATLHQVGFPVIGVLAGSNPAQLFVVYADVDLVLQTTRIYIRGGNAPAFPGATTWTPAIDVSQLLLTNFAYPIPNGAAAMRAVDLNLFIDSGGMLNLAFVDLMNGADSRIVYARSTAAMTFNTQFQTYNPIAGTDSDRYPFLAQDPTTGIINLWWDSNRTAAAAPNDYQLAFATRSAGGVWSGVSTTTQGSANPLYYPNVIFDNTGRRHLVYSEVIGPNGFIRYQMNAGPIFNISAGGNEYASSIGLTGFDVPVISFVTEPGSGSEQVFKSIKLSDTQFRAPSAYSAVPRKLTNILPLISNDQLHTLWFNVTDFGTYHDRQLDDIPPYQSAAPSAVLNTPPFGTCAADAQQIFASTASMPTGATEVQFELFTLANVSVAVSPWQVGLSYTFTNVPDNTSYYVVLRSRDAIPNVSVDSPQSGTVVIGDDTSACVAFSILQPPQVPAAPITCAVNNFVSARWNAVDNFEVANLAFFADVNQALPVGTAVNPSPLVVLTENGGFGSAIFDVTALANASYFFEGQMTGALIGSVDAWQVAPAFVKNTALNEIPQINITAPAAANQLPTNGVYNINYQYVDTVAPASTVTLYADVDNTFGNGNEVLIGSNPAAVGVGVQNGTFAWNVSNAAGPTNYIYATINDGQCSSSIYSAGTVFVAVANNFGQRIFNFPNPFSPMTANPYQSTTNIVVSLDAPSDFDLYIFNTHGQTIYRQNVTGVVGRFPNFVWDGRDSHGNIVPNGVYILKAMVKNTRQVFTGRMSVLDK